MLRCLRVFVLKDVLPNLSLRWQRVRFSEFDLFLRLILTLAILIRDLTGLIRLKKKKLAESLVRIDADR